MILLLDTAGEEAFIGLFDEKWLATAHWESGRSLSAELLGKIDNLYQKTGRSNDETTGIIVNIGPGSFTGLRIGLSVANTFAYDQNIPIVGVINGHKPDLLLEKGLKLLETKKTFDKPILPEYGSEPKITKAKK